MSQPINMSKCVSIPPAKYDQPKYVKRVQDTPPYCKRMNCWPTDPIHQYEQVCLYQPDKYEQTHHSNQMDMGNGYEELPKTSTLHRKVS